MGEGSRPEEERKTFSSIIVHISSSSITIQWQCSDEQPREGESLKGFSKAKKGGKIFITIICYLWSHHVVHNNISRGCWQQRKLGSILLTKEGVVIVLNGRWRGTAPLSAGQSRPASWPIVTKEKLRIWLLNNTPPDMYNLCWVGMRRFQFPSWTSSTLCWPMKMWGAAASNLA